MDSKHLRDIMSQYSVGENLPKKITIAEMAQDWSSPDCKNHENLWLAKQVYMKKHTAEVPDSVKDLDAALLPMRLCKEFEVDEVKEVFFGEIVSVEEVQDADGKITSQLKVKYDDGDEEHLTVEEAQEARDAYVANFIKRKNVRNVQAYQFYDAVQSAFAHHCVTSKGKPGTKSASDDWKLAAAVFYTVKDYENITGGKRTGVRKLIQLDRLAHLHLITLLHECETQKAYKDTFWDFIEPANKINDHESTNVSVAQFIIIILSLSCFLVLPLGRRVAVIIQS